jgi:ribosomal protein S18 acetylase RimI-like enzyme
MVQYKRLQPGDEELAVRAIAGIKRAITNADRVRDFLARDDQFLIVAHENSEPLGFALAYELQRVDDSPPMMFFYEIEVRPEFRRRGIGTGLVEHLKRLRRLHGAGKLFVLTDRQNKAARGLYSSSGGREEYDDGVLFVYD